jgi:hypothetical protein
MGARGRVGEKDVRQEARTDDVRTVAATVIGDDCSKKSPAPIASLLNDRTGSGRRPDPAEGDSQ